MKVNLEQRRCPDCFKAPELETIRDQVWLSCKEHGHLAAGGMVHEAIAHWNEYIAFVEKTRKSQKTQ